MSIKCFCSSSGFPGAECQCHKIKEPFENIQQKRQTVVALVKVDHREQRTDVLVFSDASDISHDTHKDKHTLRKTYRKA